MGVQVCGCKGGFAGKERLGLERPSDSSRMRWTHQPQLLAAAKICMWATLFRRMISLIWKHGEAASIHIEHKESSEGCIRCCTTHLFLDHEKDLSKGCEDLG